MAGSGLRWELATQTQNNHKGNYSRSKKCFRFQYLRIKWDRPTGKDYICERQQSWSVVCECNHKCEMTVSTYPGVVWWWCWPASLVSVLGWGQQRTVARQTFCEEQPSRCCPAQPAPARSITTDVRGHAIKIKWTFGRDFISPPAEPQLGILGDMEWRRELE